MSAALLAPWLVAAAAAVMGLFGLLHFKVTVHGKALQPRDPALAAQWTGAHMYITRETTIANAWLGFNHSHSLGLLLFGTLWTWLPLAQPQLLFGSAFLLGLGAAVLLVYNLLAWRYWFSIPQRGACTAAALYLAGVATHFLSG